MPDSPPVGIKLLSVLWAAIGAGGLLQGVFFLSVGPASRTELLLIAGGLGLSIGYIVIAYGLWKVKRWAWPAGMALAVLTVGTIFIQDQIGLVGVLVPLLILAYLATKRDVYARQPGAA